MSQLQIISQMKSGAKGRLFFNYYEKFSKNVQLRVKHFVKLERSRTKLRNKATQSANDCDRNRILKRIHERFWKRSDPRYGLKTRADSPPSSLKLFRKRTGRLRTTNRNAPPAEPQSKTRTRATECERFSGSKRHFLEKFLFFRSALRQFRTRKRTQPRMKFRKNIISAITYLNKIYLIKIFLMCAKPRKQAETSLPKGALKFRRNFGSFL